MRPSARLLALVLLASIPNAPATAAPQGPGGDEQVAAALRPFVDRGELAGAVALVADRDGVRSLDPVGFSDVAEKAPMRPDSVFWIASQSKPITATALMMLVDEAKVKLDDPVAKYLPEFRNVWVASETSEDRLVLTRPRHPITVREILSHTSGLPFKSAMEEPTLDLLPLRVAVGSYAMTPLQTEPGTAYAYSNAGINTAGRIVEVVSGQPFEEFLQRRLFQPLGMKDTTFRPDKGQIARLAKSYKPSPGGKGLEETTITQLRYPLDDPRRQPMPAGGLFSTADDLARFCRMILNRGTFEGKRYLSESSVDEMTRKQTGDALKDQYGLGWATGGDGFGHGGAYATDMHIDPKRGLITIYLVQHAGFPGEGAKALGTFRRAAEQSSGK